MRLESHLNAAVLQSLPDMDPEAHAFFLDVDGTLLDIAPTPEKVRVPVALKSDLARLLLRAKGAMSLVSGRSVENLDRLFAPLELPCVGVHGGEIRMLPERHIEVATHAPIPVEVRKSLLRISHGRRGLLFEDKGQTFAIHFRQAGPIAQALREEIEQCLAAFDMPAMQVLHGKAVFEIKPLQFSKGQAVEKLMQRPPFKTRRPVFFGDDTTDESAFESVARLGGIGVSVGRTFPNAQYVLPNPADVRGWLQRLASEGSA